MKLFFLSIFSLVVQMAFAQHPATGYEIDDYNGQTITSCDGSFFDSGGFAENC
jgi:hypothetical protein